MAGRLNGGNGGAGARYLSPAAAKVRDDALRRGALCGGDERYVTIGLEKSEIEDMKAKCQRCPVIVLCESWALEQPTPVGFVVAAGHRFVAWTLCEVCGKRCRGLPRCSKHRKILIGVEESEDLAG